MSEVVSSNADIEQTSDSQLNTFERHENDLEVKHRLEILKLLKDFIDHDDGSHRGKKKSIDVLKLFSKEPEKELINDGKDYGHSSGHEPAAGRIEFVGNESMRSIVRFNMDSYLLGLNSFEFISMFDHVHQATRGMKKKLKKVN